MPLRKNVTMTASFLFPPLSLGELQSMWSSLNVLYFKKRLPPIEIQWSTRLTASVGLFVSQSGPRTYLVSPEVRHGSGRIIRLSLPLLCNQEVDEIRSTLAHEMIHQWQFDVKKCLPSHGREFRRMMSRMNQDGLGITIYHALKVQVEVLSKYAWKCLQCGRAYHRQRKRLSPETYRCGYCLGELCEISPVTQWSRFNSPAKSMLKGLQRGVGAKPIQLAFNFMSE